MLNKEVCKKCHKKTQGKEWTDSDEFKWKQGIVICHLFNIMREISFCGEKEIPPTYCPYKLEHLLKGEK
jgi:hypothetical protein